MTEREKFMQNILDAQLTGDIKTFLERPETIDPDFVKALERNADRASKEKKHIVLDNVAKLRNAYNEHFYFAIQNVTKEKL